MSLKEWCIYSFCFKGNCLKITTRKNHKTVLAYPIYVVKKMNCSQNRISEKYFVYLLLEIFINYFTVNVYL
jgi:hypothetical protein